jgi:serine/threonine protein kinase/Tol biopolymer transport system component
VNSPPLRTLVRFEVFELDLRTRELRKSGLNVSLPDQSIKILALLLEKPGEIVLREEIRKKLWPNDTVVEFDHSINAAMKRLRQALGDPADDAHYIETLARRGYRWKVPVEWTPTPSQTQVEVVGQSVSAVVRHLIGKKVSHYRVLDVLGGGGMGVVFKAEDLKLGRSVALKFLPEETANDPPTLKRFEQEARAASALNHPNICTVYEIEEHDGQPFIVMELLEGKTLRELLATGKTSAAPLPLEELLDLAMQIAAGLDAAHQKGIIHRDVKPANVFVTTQGQAKILDFGLAKLVPLLAGAEAYLRREHRIDDEYGVPAETAPAPGSDLLLSRSGVAMGTAGYMSPEQVRGEKLDARTDLFSFGLVLYEMAAGQRAFTGKTSPIVHDAILSQTPTPIREFNPELPSTLEVIIDKALEKDRERRYQNVSEIRVDLESLRRSLEATFFRTRRGKMAAIIAILFVASAIVWLAKRQQSAPFAVPDLRLHQLTSNSADNRVTSGAISPDGKYLAYADTKAIYIKLIETGETRAVPQPEAFRREDVAWQIGPWLPGSTRFLANAHPAGESSDDWSSQGASIWLVAVLGEAPLKLRNDAIAYSTSPDGSLIAFGTNKGRRGEREIWLMAPDGQQARKLYEANEDGGVFGFTWSPDRQRVTYIKRDESGDTLVSRDMKGGPLTRLSPFPPSEAEKVREFSWLPDGRMILAIEEPGAIGSTCNFWLMRIDTRTGEVIEKAKRLTNWSGFCMAGISATTDGKRVAFLEWESHIISYVADVSADGTSVVRTRHFPLSGSSDGVNDWTPDSKAVVLVSNRSGQFGIYKQLLDENTAKPLVTEGFGRMARLTPDGRWILYFAKAGALPATVPEPVMRAPITGGPSEVLFTAKTNSLIGCARSPSDLCTIAEPTDDHAQVVITILDPFKGRGRELARFDLGSDYNNWWYALSPDGTRIAATPTPTGPIYILSLQGKPTQKIHVKGWNNLLAMTWAADGKGLLVVAGTGTGRVVLHVDLQGNAHSLWENVGAFGETLPSPSPDGHHVALSGWTMDSNMWVMENF